MKKVINPQPQSWSQLTARPQMRKVDLSQLVEEVFQDVRSRGDAALRKYTALFDKAKIDQIEVDSEAFKRAESQVSAPLKEAIEKARKNIERFHRAQQQEVVKVTTTPGIECWQETRAIESVGLYIPAGSAPLFSTILMLGIPAQIAGCKDIVLCTPCSSDGQIDPCILYTAQLLGITKVYKLGGIQAIAALTYGTETVTKVYKVFGPGNQYVTAAKQYAMLEGVAMDMPAGPSELLVLTDNSTEPAFVASDLLSQAEHGADSQVVCVAETESQLDAVIEQVNLQLPVLDRSDIASKALENAVFVALDRVEDRMRFINAYAPEHLIMACQNADLLLADIENAGSVFVGKYSPESAGDYASGTNHTLPTNGAAKAYSGIDLSAFQKKISFQKLSKEGLLAIGQTVELMAEAEGLAAHKNAISIRLNALNNE